MIKVFFLVFVPTTILTAVYVLLGHVQKTIPLLLLFYICAILILFPIELGVVLNTSKKEYGSYSLKGAFANYNKINDIRLSIYYT